MFAIFLHESMNTFYEIISSFPTVIFTIPLGISVLFWIVSMFGIVTIDVLDFDLDGDIDAMDSEIAQEGIAGVLSKLGLAGVPITIIISLISVIGWFVSYYGIYLLGPIVPSVFPIEVLFELAVLVFSLFVAVYATALFIKPIRAVFKKLDVDETKHILGQIVIVRSSLVDKKRGEGFLNDGAAGLLLNIRAKGDDIFSKGDEVVPIEFFEETNTYRVISKSEFETNI